MKTLINISKGLIMRKSVIFFLSIILITSISSCSSDDEPDVIENTFLKRFAGEKWEFIGEDYNQTFRFNDDLLNPLVIWQQQKKTETSCYYFFESYEDGFEIIEQTNDTFIIEVTWINGSQWQRFRFDFFVNEKDNIQIYNQPLTKTNKIHVICDN